MKMKRNLNEDIIYNQINNNTFLKAMSLCPISSFILELKTVKNHKLITNACRKVDI